MSGDRLVFRTAAAGDAHRLAEARWAFRIEAGETPVESASDFTARYDEFFVTALNSRQWTFWIAETSAGELIANMAVCLVQGVPRPSRLLDQWGYLTDCYTQPPFRDRGIGRQLLQHVVAWATEQDLELLLVWPSKRAENFYAAAGFEHDQEICVLPLRAYD